MATKNSTLTQERLKELLHYDPETGFFTRLISVHGSVKAGDKAGYIDARGYISIGINRHLYYCHSLAWLYTYGFWPEHGLDHRDGNPSNNKLSNLREATQAENLQNSKTNKNNKSGFIGVCFDKQSNKWTSQITINWTKKHLGVFSTPEEASVAYLQAKASLHTFNPIPR